MPDLRGRSALPGGMRRYLSAQLQIRELQAVTKVRVQALRSRGPSSPVADAHKLPAAPNTTIDGDPIALWKAPDDWLVYSQTLSASALGEWVEAIPSSAPLFATDVSSASTVFELSGVRALDVLLRDCALDLEGDAIHPGGCAQTQFAQTSVLLHRPASSSSWRLFVERSVAGHVWDWLLDTAGPADGAVS